MNKGYVYILVNESMPGLVKIGRTSNSPCDRAKALSGATGVPTPFRVAFCVYTPNCVDVEYHMHQMHAAERVNDGREFFRVDWRQAAQNLEDFHRSEVERWLEEFLPDHTPVPNEEVVDPSYQAEITRALGLIQPDFPNLVAHIEPKELAAAAERHKAWVSERKQSKARLQ